MPCRLWITSFFPHFVNFVLSDLEQKLKVRKAQSQYELSVSTRYMACSLHLVLFVFKPRTLTLCTAHFSEYRDSYTDMLINNSLLRCRDTYLCNAELY